MKSVTQYFLILSAVFAFAQHARALEVGDMAPCVVLDGVNSEGSSHTGCIRDAEDATHVFTILDFFSVDCSTCMASVPALNLLATEVEGLATVRQVSVDRDLSKIENYLIEKADLINFPVAFDLDRDAKRAYGVIQTPTIFVLEKLAPFQFKIIFKHEGLLTEEGAEEIAHLVGAK